MRSCALSLRPEMSDEELLALQNHLQSESLHGNHLEVGTAAGGTLCHLMKQYSEDKRPAFYVVDTMEYFPQQQEIVRRNLSQNGLSHNSVHFFVMNSRAAQRECEKQELFFDFILIDASHKIRDVMDDLRWLRFLNLGGIACFHDYSTRFKGVVWPIDRFLKKNDHYKKVELAGSLLFLRKLSHVTKSEVNLVDFAWSRILAPVLVADRFIRKRIRRGKKLTA
jgi:predicted O-methyltransferase YrrM